MIFLKYRLVIFFLFLLDFSSQTPKEILFIDSSPLDWCSTSDPYEKSLFGGQSVSEIESVLNSAGFIEKNDYIFRCESDITSAKNKLNSEEAGNIFFIFSQWILVDDLENYNFALFDQEKLSIIQKDEKDYNVFRVFDVGVWVFLFFLPIFGG